jgi:hypothetical protein
MKSHLGDARGPFALAIAVLAERLRRQLKALVRKSVGSIPTDCNLLFCCVRFFPAFCVFLYHKTEEEAAGFCARTSGYSSVGRAGDCRWQQLISLGHWFDSGCPDSLFVATLAAKEKQPNTKKG